MIVLKKSNEQKSYPFQLVVKFGVFLIYGLKTKKSSHKKKTQGIRRQEKKG